MVMDLKSNPLVPFDFEHLYKQVPELEKFDLELSVNSFEAPIDSSDMTINAWQKMATIIHKNYHLYDGFVILHGSDTMAYTASALSFMLENLAKPVILTGSQLPIGMIRTDGKENLITAIEIAGAKNNNGPMPQAKTAMKTARIGNSVIFLRPNATILTSIFRARANQFSRSRHHPR